MEYHNDGQGAVALGRCSRLFGDSPKRERERSRNFTALLNWSLRDYGIEPSVWGLPGGVGGATWCLNPFFGDHIWGDESSAEAYTGTKRWQHSVNEPELITRENQPEAWGSVTRGATCSRCGAWRGALGLEPTPDLFIAHMVEVFREVRRVLRKDGTCWVNIGDSYAANGNGGGSVFDNGRTDGRKSYESDKARGREKDLARIPPGLKPKDMVGIPWMLAFALRADGWWLRDEIIWHKPNPMPASVRDRTTRAHEQVFLLTKSARYWYDADAIREPAIHAGESVSLGAKSLSRGQATGMGVAASGNGNAEVVIVADGRNKRSVWSIPTAPFPEAHFATYPPDLVRPCVLAGCPEGGTVLDPFSGSGTTAMVARQLGRRAIGIDLNPDYLAMSLRRIGQPVMEMCIPEPPSEAAMAEQLSMFNEVAG